MLNDFFGYTCSLILVFLLPIFWTTEFTADAAVSAAGGWIDHMKGSREIARTGSIHTKSMSNGTCDDGFEWTVILPISDLGATCCPTGYKGEYEIATPLKLATVFCCPEADDQIPCSKYDRELPSTPLDCPPGTTSVGSQCEREQGLDSRD